MMRKLALIIMSVAALAAFAAKKQEPARPYAWRTVEPLGLHVETGIDTLLLNYPLRSVPSEVSTAWASTGNLGGEGINMLYMERPGMSEFFFRDALRAWMPDLGSHTFYNTRIPMTLLSYNTGGGKQNEQNRLQATFSGNVGPRLQIGAQLDYLYSKGSYNYQAVNDMTWGISGSYMGERWQLMANYVHYNLLNKENGGITNDMYITDPAALQGGDDNIDVKTIPTYLSAAHSKIVGGQLYMNNRYNVGYWKEIPVNDTLSTKKYQPVVAFIWTLDYRNDKHLFINTNGQEARKFWQNCYQDWDFTRDRTTFWTVRNTIGAEMLEGFNKWVPFGLSVYATHEVCRYRLPADTIARDDAGLPTDGSDLTPWPGNINKVYATTQNYMWVGGQLTKQRGEAIKFDATAEFGVLPPVIGELRLEGNASSRFRLLGDTVSVNAGVLFTNMTSPWLMCHYVSNFFVWDNDFGDTRRLRVGGSIDIPHTGTNISAGFENVQNLIYFGPDCLPAQYGGSVQVVSATLKQRLRVGILHWDNNITYQTSTNQAVVPLPKLAIRSDLYLWFKIARVLQVQFGVDCDYYTRYYAPGYQPATMSFYNQRDSQVGNYPFMNVYLNCRLKRARFYVMFSHVNQGLMGKNYFALPHYPMNPRRFQMGVSVDFAN